MRHIFITNKEIYYIPLCYSILQKMPLDLSMGLDVEHCWEFRVYSLAKRWQCCNAELQMSFLLLDPLLQTGHCLPLQQLFFPREPRNLSSSHGTTALKCKNNVRINH